MKDDDFNKLDRGDIVVHKTDKRHFIVTNNYGGRVTGVATIDMTNPSEWELRRKATYGNFIYED